MLPQSYACLWLSPGYEENFYWWECVVMLRKFVLVLVAVLFSNQGNALQIYAGIGVVVFFLLFLVLASIWKKGQGKKHHGPCWWRHSRPLPCPPPCH